MILKWQTFVGFMGEIWNQKNSFQTGRKRNHEIYFNPFPGLQTLCI